MSVKKWKVLDPRGRVLYAGSRNDCREAMKRIRRDGNEDWLRIVSANGERRRDRAADREGAS